MIRSQVVHPLSTVPAGEKNEEFRGCFPKGFHPKFVGLTASLRGLSSTKQLWEAEDRYIPPAKPVQDVDYRWDYVLD